MHLLQQPARHSYRGGNSRRRPREPYEVYIPTTINEENSTKSSSSSTEKRRRFSDRRKKKTDIGGLGEDYEEESCSGSCSQTGSRGQNCSCDCEFCKSFYDQESYESDTFCETCADAGLVECCHIPPQPGIRLALLRNLKEEEGGDKWGQMTEECEKKNIPKITLDHYE